MKARFLQLGIIATIVILALIGVKTQYHASVEDQEDIEDPIVCEHDINGQMNECSGIPDGGPCGPNGEGICAEVAGGYCDCIDENGQRIGSEWKEEDEYDDLPGEDEVEGEEEEG